MQRKILRRQAKRERDAMELQKRGTSANTFKQIQLSRVVEKQHKLPSI
jgi:hypothetical protein